MMKKAQTLLLLFSMLMINEINCQDKYLKAYMADSLSTLAFQAMIGVDNSLILLGKADKGACMFKIDQTSGKVIWCLRDKNLDNDGLFQIGSQDGVGNIYLKGGKSSSNGSFIAKFNKNGKLIKKRHLNLSNFGIGWSFLFVDDNTIVVPIMISNPSRGGVMCLDSNLNIKWFKYINNPEAYNFDLLINEKYIFIMGASTLQNSNKYEMMITKLTLQGDFVSAVIVRRANKELNCDYSTIYKGTICATVFDETEPGKTKSMLAFIDTSLNTIYCKRYDTPIASSFTTPNISPNGDLIVQGVMDSPDGKPFGRTTLASMNMDGSLNFFKGTSIEDGTNDTNGPRSTIDSYNNFYCTYINSVLTVLPPPQKSYYFKKQIISKFSLNDPDPCFMEDIPVSIVDIPLELVPLTVEVKDTMFAFAQSTTVFDFQYVDMVVETLCEEVSTKDEDSQPQAVKIYPNPTRSQINLSIEGDNGLTFPAIFSLYDILGHEVLNTNVVYGTEDIDVSRLSNGMYIWNLSSNGQISGQGKLAVER